jgi:hypothetical protein
MGKSKIDRLGLGDKVRAYVQSGLSNEDILRHMNIEHPQLKISASALSRFLTKNPLLDAGDERAISEAKGRLVETTVDSIEAVRAMLRETITEIVSFLDEHRADPKDAAAFLRLKLEALDKMARMLGGYAPSTQVNIGLIVPAIGDPRCEQCPYKGRLTIEELRAALKEG